MTPENTSNPSEQRDARHVPLSTADKLAQDAAEAKRVRALANHPHVVALRTEKVRTQVDAALWAGILLGLAFTMVNVQSFAAAGAPAWSLTWCAAWLLDPMVSITLIAVLRAEQVTARYQVHTGVWAHRTKWFTFAATYLMNTWAAWHRLDSAEIVLHSVPPILVFCAAETAPWLRDRLTEAINRAEAAGPMETESADQHGSAAEAADVHEHALPDRSEPVHASAASAHDRPDSPAASTTGRRAKQAATSAPRRTSRAQYLAAARAAYTPGVVITPAWIREATGCSRGLSSELAEQLRTELASPPETERLASRAGEETAA